MQKFYKLQSYSQQRKSSMSIQLKDYLNSIFQESFRVKSLEHPKWKEAESEKQPKNQNKKAQLIDFTSMFKKRHPKVRKKPIKILKSNTKNADLAQVLTPKSLSNKQNQSINLNESCSQNIQLTDSIAPKKQSNEDEEEQEDQEIKEYFQIPMNLTITQQQMRMKRCLDIRRWFCLQRPQYSKSCGISSLISCWNYLFSTLGTGTHRPLSQQQALTVLGFQPPFSQISFGKFTGNPTLIKWFRLINAYFGIKNGRARIFWKLHGKNRTIGIDPPLALKNLKQSLLGEN